MSKPYGTAFYDQIGQGSEASARAIVPTVVDLVRPSSVVDVGCGDGSWLQVFGDLGVTDLLGVDGPWVSTSALKIPVSRFRAADLEGPLPVERRFDLALSLEVVEHLPEHLAMTFVERLTALAPVVLFSAAVPDQGGTGHVNEQWADYWAEHFARLGFVLLDVIRPAFWEHPGIEPWYVQNTFLYASAEARAANDDLAAAAAAGLAMPARVVHPGLLHHATSSARLSVADHVRDLPRAARAAASKRAGRRRAGR